MYGFFISTQGSNSIDGGTSGQFMSVSGSTEVLNGLYYYYQRNGGNNDFTTCTYSCRYRNILNPLGYNRIIIP